MKILSLSLDPLIFNKESVVAIRNARYGELLEKYDIIVPSSSIGTVALSPKVTVYGTGGAIKPVQFFNMLKLASALAKKGRYDLITSQDTYYVGLIGLCISKIYKIGFEVQVHGIEKLNLLRKLVSRLVLSHAHSIRIVGQRLAQRLVKEFGIEEDNIVLVPIHVDVSSMELEAQAGTPKIQELENLRRQFNARYVNRFNILSVSRLVPIKNIPMLIEVIAHLKESFPQVLLHIVGEGPLRKELQNLIDKRQLSEHVIMHGPLFNVELGVFFAQSDCFVLGSDYEGYGMVLVEAATAGVPIVTTDVGCADELFENNRSAIIIPPGDVDAFTQALHRILNDEQLRTTLQKKSKEAIAALPSFDMILQRYMLSWRRAATRAREL
jgi:glycosyltransferase involved in cell wall biosynthesis